MPVMKNVSHQKTLYVNLSEFIAQVPDGHSCKVSSPIGGTTVKTPSTLAIPGTLVTPSTLSTPNTL